jgi:hypothetical protein
VEETHAEGVAARRFRAARKRAERLMLEGKGDPVSP